jgi:hypothetical protein
MKRTLIIISAIAMVLFANLSLAKNNSQESRTIEFPFSLSSDFRSEFRARTPLVSAGLVQIEAQWTPLKRTQQNSVLSVVFVKPNGAEAARLSGRSPLKLQHRVTDADLELLSTNSSWGVKLINDSDTNRDEVEGKVRITLPITTKLLVNTQFTLLSQGNAQEVGFSVAAPGRLVMEADWQSDQLGSTSSMMPQLSLQLIHSGQDKTYAKRKGTNALRVEHQVTEQEIDSGLRWVARIQNEGQVKVKGLLKVTFSPSM